MQVYIKVQMVLENKNVKSNQYTNNTDNKNNLL